MATEQDRTLQVLQIALRLEIDGKEFYLKASRESNNELGKQLLQQLAAEEDIHRQKFEQIFDAIRSSKAWPVTDFHPDGGKVLRTIFARATEDLGSSVKTPATELEAVKTAMDMESKTYDFYQGQLKIVTHDAERDFYQALSIQEREHQLVLLDYYEYLKDPGGWFVKTEHPSLDGG